jgi:TonB-dependent receptor
MAINGQSAFRGETLARLRGSAALWALIAGLSASPALAQTTTPPADQAQAPEQAPKSPNAEGVQQAQPTATDNSATPSQAIVVTGFRSSIAAALSEKRNASGVIDVIKAEDIAKFPDNNLAESIQRIPGVAITRDQGEGRNISVRGLSPLFTRVRIDGLEGLSTTGGADSSGGANRGRQFDFNTFASELFNNIVVRKTPSAEIEEGSLGATVDLNTAHPLDYTKDLTIAASAEAGYNDFSKSWDPRFAGLISKKFADGRLGVLVSAAYSTRGILEEGPSTVRWEPANADGGFNAASTPPAGVTGAPSTWTFFAPRIPRYDSYAYDTKRFGLTGSIQFKPTDKTLITLDGLYSYFRSNRQEQYLEAISFSRSGTGKPQTVILPGAVVDDTNSLVSGTFNNVDARVESRFDTLHTRFKQLTATINHEFNDRLKMNLLAGYSRSDFANPIQTTVALDAPNIQGYSYDYSNGRFPTLNYGNLDVTNPNSWTLGEIRLRPQYVTNTFKVARGDLGYKFSPAFILKAGADYKEYSFNSREYRRASETQVPTLAPGQLASLSDLYTIRTDLPDGTPPSFVVPNLNAFADALGFYSNTGMFQLFGVDNATARSNWRTVKERDLGLWTQGDFNFDLGALRVRGNLGGRWVQTRQHSTGYTNQASGFTLVAVDRTYDNFLPALNVAADLTRDIVLRGAVAKVLARPDIGTLSPGGSFSVSGGNRTFTRGNPDLTPTEAWSYDLSGEWYFAPQSAFIIGLFYKHIDSFIATTQQQIPFNQLGLPDSILAGTGATTSDIFTVTQPVNSNGGNLKGAEISFQAPFRFLPGFLRNFGVLANYTYVDSKVKYPLTTAANAPTINYPLVGLSKHTFNGTLYYEDKKFMVRGSVSHRSRYLDTVPGRNGVSSTDPNFAQPGYNDAEGHNGTTYVDVSASYNITPNLTLTFDGLNLTDQYEDQFIDTEADRVSVYHHTGRQFYGGVRFKF